MHAVQVNLLMFLSKTKSKTYMKISKNTHENIQNQTLITIANGDFELVTIASVYLGKIRNIWIKRKYLVFNFSFIIIDGNYWRFYNAVLKKRDNFTIYCRRNCLGSKQLPNLQVLEMLVSFVSENWLVVVPDWYWTRIKLQLLRFFKWFCKTFASQVISWKLLKKIQ